MLDCDNYSPLSLIDSEPGDLGSLIRDLGLDEFRKLRERLLPAEIAHFQRDRFRQPFLHDAELGSARDLLQCHRRLHFSGQVRIVESIRIADLLEWHEFAVLAAKGVAVARREVRERHLVGTADPGIHVMNLAGETVWRDPLRHRVSIQKRPVDPFRIRTEHTVKSDDAYRHD